MLDEAKDSVKADLQRRVSELEARVRGLEADVAATTDEMNDARAQARQAYEKLQEERGRIAHLRREAIAARGEIDGLRSCVAAYNSEITALREEVDTSRALVLSFQSTKIWRLRNFVRRALGRGT